MKRWLRAARLAAALLLLGLLVPAPVPVPAEKMPGMPEITLSWAAGEYIASVICTLPSGPARVARKARIDPPRRRQPRLTFRLDIAPMGSGEIPCANDLGEPEPELQARAHFYYDGPARPDTARRDFQQMLRRDRAVTFKVESGQLVVGEGEKARTVSLKGATLEIGLLGPGSDAARMLGNVGNLGKRSLTIEARDGTLVKIHAVHVVPRPDR